MNQIQVPKGWSINKINDLCEVVRGGSPRPKGDPRYFDGPIPWIKISDVTASHGKHITKTEEGLKEAGISKSRFLKSGTLVLTNSATICLPKILKIDGCIHDGFLAFLKLDKKIDQSYLYYYFLMQRQKITHEVARGLAQKNLNTTLVGNLEIFYPDIKIQREIVQKLDYILGQLEERKKMILGLFEKSSERIKFLQQNIHRLVLHEYFPLKPSSNWNTKKLEEIAEIGQGGTPSTSKSEYWNGNIPWLRSGELLDNVIYDSEFKITKKGLGESSTKLCPKGTIMIAMTGQGLTRGRTALLGIEACANQSCAHIINTGIEIRTDFLWNFLKSRYWFIRGIHHGSGQPGINVSIIKKLEVSYPSLNEQEIILRKINNIKNSVLSEKEKLVEVHKNIQKKISEINSIQTTILNVAFSGKLVN
jgi:type I restriction enzyme S subunit